jgi:membrane protein required for colicin V production
MQFGYFDIIVLGLIGFFAFTGLRRGLIAEIFRLLGILFAVFFAMKYINYAAILVKRTFDTSNQISSFIGFLVIFILVLVIARFISGIFQKFINFVMLGWLDHIGGLGFGFLKGAFIISYVLWLVALLPNTNFMKRLEKETATYSVLKNLAPRFFDTAMSIFPEAGNITDKIKGVIPDKGKKSKKSSDFDDMLKRIKP